MENISNNYKETKLNIEISSGYTHDTPLQMAQNQIEKAAIYLFSIFHLLKTSALNLENVSLDSETNDFYGDVQNLSDIGIGIISTIQTSAMTMIAPIDESAINTDAESEKPLAVQLSELMNNPNLPVEMFNAFEEAFTVLRNDLTGEKEQKLLAHERTPEYFKDFLGVYADE